MNETLASSIDAVFGLVDREVWIVTAADRDGRQGGLVATWLSQASIDRQRPMVVAGLAPNHFTAELVERSGRFVAHLISADQIDLAWRFGLATAREIDKFADLSILNLTGSAPILTAALAWLDCKVIAKYDTGDRSYFWADVVDGKKQRAGVPLRSRELFAAASDEQRRQLSSAMLADVRELAAGAAQWRAALPALPVASLNRPK